MQLTIWWLNEKLGEAVYDEAHLETGDVVVLTKLKANPGAGNCTQIIEIIIKTLYDESICYIIGLNL